MKQRRKRKKRKPLIPYDECVRRVDIYIREEKKYMKEWIRKLFKRILQPKITFGKDTYMIYHYGLNGALVGRWQRGLWHNAILSDVQLAFGSMWPGFTSLPGLRCYGRAHAVYLQTDNGMYLLFRMERK
jgi:hypothetical protein